MQPFIQRVTVRGQTACLVPNRGFNKLYIQRRSDAAGYRVLEVQQGTAFAGKAICPDMRAALGIDQLRIDLHCRTEPPYAPLQEIANATFPTDLPCIYRLSLVGQRSCAGNYESTLKA